MSNGLGNINLYNFPLYLKNPTIARIFKEIGHADELGSGTRNLIKYAKKYSDQPIEMIEDDIFKTIVHVTDQASGQVTDQATMQAAMQAAMQADQKEKTLSFCKTPRTRKEIQEYLRIKNREYFRREILNPLIAEGMLDLTLPDKPRSPKQKYITVNHRKYT